MDNTPENNKGGFLPPPDIDARVPKITTVHDEDNREVYADGAAVDFNFYTFTLAFSRLSRDPDVATSLINNVLMTILMSPEQAKALLQLLAARVAAYETQVGAIRTPEQKAKSPIVVPSKRILS